MDNLNLISAEEISPPMTKLEADAILEEVYQLDRQIEAEEAQRDAFTNVYKAEIERQQLKIATANEQCEAAIKPLLAKRAVLELQLRQFTEANVTDKRRSIPLPTAKLQLVKSQPKFFDPSLKEINGYNEWLIEFAKQHAPACLKTKLSVDWLKLKSMLKIDDEIVSFKETGEVIDGLRVQTFPDKFKIEWTRAEFGEKK